MKYKTIYGKGYRSKIKSNNEIYYLKNLSGYLGYGYFTISNNFTGGWEIIRIFPLDCVNIEVRDSLNV